MGSSLAHVALAGVTVVGWIGAGELLLVRAAAFGGALLGLLNRLVVGAAAFALATFAAGWAGGLSRWAVVAALAATVVPGAAAVRRAAATATRPSWRGLPRWQQALAALLVVYAVLGVVATCAPISSPDALFYHAAAPAQFALAGEIRELPWSWQSYQPFTVELLVLDGMLLWDPVQGAFAPFALGVAATLAVAGAARRILGPGAALPAAALLAAQPFFLWEASSTFVEPALALAVALAGWNLWEWAATGRRAPLVLASLCGGVAAGTKLTGLVAAVLLLGVGAALRPQLLRPGTLALAALPGLALAAPWYVKNAVLTGDPLYPLLSGGPNPAAEASRDAILSGYGHGRSLVDALLLPFRLVGDADEFDLGEFLSPLLFGLAPAALLDRRGRRVAVLVLAAFAVYLLAWFVTSQQARFLVPAFPALAVLGVAGGRALAGRGRLGRAGVAVAGAGALAAGLAVSLVYTAQFVPVAVGAERADAFLLRKTSYYELDRWIDDHLPPDAHVLLESPNVLYVGRRATSLSLDVLPLDAPPSAARELVRREGITHVVLSTIGAERSAQFAPLRLRGIARVRAQEVISRTRAEFGSVVEFVVLTVADAPLGSSR